MPLSVGMVLSTGETVTEVINGGFAQVGILQDELVGRKVVKRMRDEVRAAAERPGDLNEAFFRECHVAVSTLEGAPYVGASLLALRQLDGLGPVMFMSFVDGPSLSQLLSGGRQSMSQSLRIGWQVARALEFAHDRKVRHRDLKANNIMLTTSNEVRVIDWGLSRVNDAVGRTVGRIELFSPQRRENPQLDDAADDVYALGVNLYHCLTGHLPPLRDGDVAAALVEAHPKLPEDFLRTVVAMLSAEPGVRPDAAEVAAVLGDPQLAADVLDREVEEPFCEGCGYVAAELAEACPVCGCQMFQRVARPPREGMVRIPAGMFWHGLSEDQARNAFVAVHQEPTPHDLQRLAPPDDPQRRVFCAAFDIDRTPVTNRQFGEFVKAVNYTMPEGLYAAERGLPDHPVAEIAWKDALCYALWAGKRLPTPREWEKAARGAEDRRMYPWGDVWDGNRCNHSQQPMTRTTSPVDAFSKGAADGSSPFGVLDMAGDVREWVSEGEHADSRGLRGGGWAEPVALFGVVTSQVDALVDYQDKQTGFRCAADIVYDVVPVVPEVARDTPGPDQAGFGRDRGGGEVALK